MSITSPDGGHVQAVELAMHRHLRARVPSIAHRAAGLVPRFAAGYRRSARSSVQER